MALGCVWASAIGAVRAAPIALAVLGDSDSHGYQDGTAFASNGARGGRFHATTLQWTEVIAARRADHLDLGTRGRWGSRRWQVPLQRLLGWPYRLPRKEDHRFNFAWTGARCEDLMHGEYRQAERLAEEIERDRGRWRDGIVVVRIGVNSIGMEDMLERLARGRPGAEVDGPIDACIDAVRTAVDLLVRTQPDLRFVLVGILDNADWPPYLGRWQSSVELARIGAGLDRFDRGLRTLVAADPRRRAFFDDRRWFAGLWGGRDAAGRPAYRTVMLPGGPAVRHAQCDAPVCSVLQDGHAGLAWNALWAGALIELLDTRFAAGVPPLTTAEVAELVRAAAVQRDD